MVWRQPELYIPHHIFQVSILCMMNLPLVNEFCNMDLLIQVHVNPSPSPLSDPNIHRNAWEILFCLIKKSIEILIEILKMNQESDYYL